MREKGLSISVIIANYNYAQFLSDAINSALDQTYPDVEVIVVDDGSTDSSREIIAAFGDRIVPVLKENGGHGSAVNAGFAVANGDLICLLDSDDLFLPNKCAAVVQAWTENQDACIIYHQLQSVDGNSRPKGRPWPASVWHSSIRRRVERSGGWWPHPVTSGLSFPRNFLDRAMPIPNDRRIFPDTYLAGLAAFAGPVIGIKAPMTLYRVHDRNISSSFTPRNEEDRDGDQTVLRQSLVRYEFELETLKRALNERLGLDSSISLDDHWVYQRRCMAVGNGGSLSTLLWLVGSCAALTPSLKAREMARIVLNRW